MITIKDIAKLAHVSTATVSYILNGTKNISQETRERVMNVIEETNFSPNRIAQSLRINKTNSIGVLAEDIRGLPVPGIINGITEYMDSVGYNILLSDLRLLEKLYNRYGEISNYKGKIKSAVDLLNNAQVDGIIYIGVHDRDIEGIIDSRDKPVVFSYCYTYNDADVYVTYDNMLAAYEITKYLIDMNHERIAVISGPTDSYPSIKRFDGFYKAMFENNLRYDYPGYIHAGDWEYKSGFDIAMELLNLKNPPTAIFAMNDLMAIGAIDAIQKMGFSVPDDFSVVGFDDREFSSFTKPKLTTVSLPFKEIGYNSARLITDIINKVPLEKSGYVLPCKLIKRETVCMLK
jgi:LacI family transcriptional regulator